MRKSTFSGLLIFSSFWLMNPVALADEHRAVKRSSQQTNTVKVAAEISYLEENTGLNNLKVRIQRNNKLIVNSALPVALLQNYDAEYGVKGIGAEIKVIDLDNNKEPEILVDFAEAGAHCCSSTFIYSYDARAKKYNVTTHFWGNYTSGYWLSEISGEENDRNLPDLNKDGIPEFVAIDDRFRGEFGSYAMSAAPVQIWRYHQGKLLDVTREFPQVVYQNTVDLWQMYTQVRREYGATSAQGAMVASRTAAGIAAYVASKSILGQQADAMQRVRQAYPDRNGTFISKLSSFLRKSGYNLPK